MYVIKNTYWTISTSLQFVVNRPERCSCFVFHDRVTTCNAFKTLAGERIRIGFTLDPIPARYTPYPKLAGAALERTAAVLAIQGFASDVFSGLVRQSRAVIHFDN